MIAYIFVGTLYLYLAIGACFGLWFVWKGAARLDEGMFGVSRWLKVLIFPGSVLLWPVLFLKIRRQAASKH